MTALVVSIVQQDLFVALASFLAGVTGLVPGVRILQALPNRASMPSPVPGFIVMTIIDRGRVTTNIDTETGDDPQTTEHEAHFKVTVQLDFYSGQTGSAGDWCSMIETLWRDPYACTALAPVCQPLYTNPSHMAPLEDSEDQYEQRWILDAVLQYNPVTSAPVQTANVLGPVGIVDVEVAYGP